MNNKLVLFTLPHTYTYTLSTSLHSIWFQFTKMIDRSFISQTLLEKRPTRKPSSLRTDTSVLFNFAKKQRLGLIEDIGRQQEQVSQQLHRQPPRKQRRRCSQASQGSISFGYRLSGDVREEYAKNRVKGPWREKMWTREAIRELHHSRWSDKASSLSQRYSSLTEFLCVYYLDGLVQSKGITQYHSPHRYHCDEENEQTTVDRPWRFYVLGRQLSPVRDV